MRTAGFIAFGVAIHQVAAHGGWTDAQSFSCPSNTDNQCSQDQQQGFDWSKSTDVNQYGGFGFSGFTYADSFHSKRDLAPRTSGFQDKCIKGSIAKDTPTPPKISCDSGKSFSIDEFQVTTSEDIDLEFTYGYDNGDHCKHTTSCSKSGSTVKNSQCGGATSVTFTIPKDSKQSSCDVGIHRVNFNCGPPSRPSSPPSTSSVPVSKSSTAVRQSSSLSLSSSSHGIPTGNLSSHAATGTPPATETAPVTIPFTSFGSSAPASTPVSSTFISSTKFSTSTLPVLISSSASSSATPSTSPTVVTGSVLSSPIPSSSLTVATGSVSSSPIPSLSLTSSSEVATTLVSSSPIPSTSLTSSSEVVTGSVSSSPIPSTSLTSSSEVVTGSVSSSPTPSTFLTSTSEVATTSLPAGSTPASLPASSAASSAVSSASVPEVTVPVVTTQIVVTTLTTCPVTNTVTSGSTQIVQSSFTVSTILSTITSTVCTKCVAPKPSTLAASSVSVPPSSLTPVATGSTSIVPSQGPGTSPVPSIPGVSTPVSSLTASITQSSGTASIPSVPLTTHEVVTTQIIRTTLTTCPVTETIRSGTSESIRVTQTVSTVLSTLTSTVCTKCFAPSETQIISSVPTSQSSSAASGPPPAPAPAPPVLPKCLNTWITLTKCESNADSSCYCKDSEFTKNVQDCVSCWSADSSEVQAALSYLAGICAPDVQANPGIITNVPISITLGPGPIVTPAPSGSPATQAGTITAPAPVSLPVTIISLVETVTLPITYISGSSTGQPISSSFIISVISTQVTVPQVKFTTDTLPAGATGRPDVGLAAGSPVPVTAIPTSVSLSTFATGRTATGGSVVAQTSITPFIGGAGRASSGILRAVVVAALGLLVGI